MALMPDLHAQFIRKDTDEPDAPASGVAGYEAFRVVDRRQLSLHIRPAQGECCHWVNYSTLLRMEGGNPAGSSLLLFFTCLAVSIEGRNLNGVADAIAKQRCAFVEAFDLARHTSLNDPFAPFIAHITTFAPGDPVRLKASPK